MQHVLLIGDSITWGYSNEVRRLLAGQAEVTLIPDNAQTTVFGLQQLADWLGDTRWDVIHFNWGLWDLCYRDPPSLNQGNRDKINGTVSVPLADYATNLTELVTRLTATGARLIWASITPIPDGELGRITGDEVKYNAVAEKIMRAHQIEIDDLYTGILPHCQELQLPDGDVHFTEAGYAFLARQVVGCILQAQPEFARSL